MYRISNIPTQKKMYLGLEEDEFKKQRHYDHIQSLGNILNYYTMHKHNKAMFLCFQEKLVTPVSKSG